MKLVASLIATFGLVSALPSVTRQGRFLYANGSRFVIKGIAYQPQGDVTSANPTAFPEPSDFDDPLADPSGCQRDLPYLQQLGVNTVRVYSVDSAKNHDACMQAFSAAGIYVILDLALPVNGSIDRASPSWTTNLLTLYTGTIDTFNGYDNVLAYNIGNEVVKDVPSTVAAPFIKAATRDIKAYLSSKGSTTLVSYSSTDGDPGWRLTLANYLACGDPSTSIDLYGLNAYRWCGDATIATAEAGLLGDYANFPIPAYYSEFGQIFNPGQGCSQQRTWSEVDALFSQDLTGTWSGGVAFSYFPTFQGFGMVNITSDGKSVVTGSDFANLKTHYSAINLSTLTLPDQAQSSAGSSSQATCPAASATFLASLTLPPTPIGTSCTCLTTSALTCAFTNGASPNAAAIAGELLNYICPQLGTKGGSCDPIGANGQTGVYGAFSGCDPSTKLSYAITEYYELFARAAGTCDFQGNATIVSGGPADTASEQAAIQQCAGEAFTGTTVPPAPSSTSKAASTATGSAGSGSGGGGGSGGSGQGSGAIHTEAWGGGLLLSIFAGVVVLFL